MVQPRSLWNEHGIRGDSRRMCEPSWARRSRLELDDFKCDLVSAATTPIGRRSRGARLPLGRGHRAKISDFPARSRRTVCVGPEGVRRAAGAPPIIIRASAERITASRSPRFEARSCTRSFLAAQGGHAQIGPWDTSRSCRNATANGHRWGPEPTRELRRGRPGVVGAGAGNCRHSSTSGTPR